MNKCFDVTVIGAGPAGLSAARSAAQRGARTLLVERKKEIGVPVRCGEFFPTFGESLRIWPNAHSLRGFHTMLSREVISNKIRKIRLFSPQNKIFEFDFEGYALRRDLFEKRVSQEAESQGAIVQLSTRAESITKKLYTKKVLLSGPRGESFVESKILIGADGFPSKIAELANMRQEFKPQDAALCIQQRMTKAELIEEDTMEMFFSQKYAPGGFAWIIPKGVGEVNVGLGVRFSNLSKTVPISHFLNAFLDKHPVASDYFLRAQPSSLICKIIPVGGLTANICKNGTLLAGDAAGAVIAINGCGIPNALISGHLAGKIAADSLNGICKLSAYANEVKEEIGRVLQRGHLYRRFGDKFIKSDRAFGTILQALGARNLAKVMRCEPVWRLGANTHISFFKGRK